jgi:hypothetical protein
LADFDVYERPRNRWMACFQHDIVLIYKKDVVIDSERDVLFMIYLLNLQFSLSDSTI